MAEVKGKLDKKWSCVVIESVYDGSTFTAKSRPFHQIRVAGVDSPMNGQTIMVEAKRVKILTIDGMKYEPDRLIREYTITKIRAKSAKRLVKLSPAEVSRIKSLVVTAERECRRAINDQSARN